MTVVVLVCVIGGPAVGVTTTVDVTVVVDGPACVDGLTSTVAVPV